MLPMSRTNAFTFISLIKTYIFSSATSRFLVLVFDCLHFLIDRLRKEDNYIRFEMTVNLVIGVFEDDAKERPVRRSALIQQITTSN